MKLADEILNQYGALVDPVFGIVKQVYQVEGLAGDPGLFHFATEVTDTLRFSENSNYQSNGGAGLNYEHAIRAAVGESIERYASSIYSKKEFIFGSYAEIAGAHHLGREKKLALDPVDIPLFSSKQYAESNFPYRPFTRQTKTYWVEGFSLLSHQPVLVPAPLVYVPYFFGENEPPFTISSSSGLAFAPSLDEAILSGLLELVERDAFMRMWMLRQSFPKINLETLPPQLDKILRTAFCHSREQIQVMDITSDIGLPVYFTAFVGIHPRVAVGAACRINSEAAFTKALVEAAQTQLWARYLLFSQEKYQFNDDFSDIESFDQHVLLYARDESFPMFQFVLDNPVVKNLINGADVLSDNSNKKQSTPTADLSICLAALRRVGIDEVIYVDLTPPDVKASGFFIAKVIVPGLVPLGVGTSGVCLGHPRLSGAVNFDPHPFP